MRIALYPGSFDPVTLGHLDVIRRAAAQFDELIVCTMYNSEKRSGLFTPEERVELLRRSVAGLDNVRVDAASGLLVDYARAQGVCCVVKGIRTVADFEMEKQMADVNRGLCPELETMFLMARPEYGHISSTIVKELARYGVDLTGYVPDCIRADVAARMKQAIGKKEG